MRPLRSRMQIVFQDPFASLNPRMSIRQIIEEGLIVNRIGDNNRDRLERVRQSLRDAGLPDDILSRTGWLRDYAEWFANIFPYMSRAAAHSAFPEVTLFFHAVMWTIAPVWLGALLLIKHDKRLYEKQRERRWFLLFAVPIMLGAMILMLKITFTSDELTRVEKIMSYSRFGLGFSGTAAYAGWRTAAHLALC